MGNTEGIPINEMTSSVKTSSKVFGKDERKLSCEREKYSACVEDEVETIGNATETMAADNSTLADAEKVKPSIPNPTSNNNR